MEGLPYCNLYGSKLGDQKLVLLGLNPRNLQRNSSIFLKDSECSCPDSRRKTPQGFLSYAYGIPHFYFPYLYCPRSQEATIFERLRFWSSK
ncbi:hypothetical protein TNCV_2709491 [Trichonephila clavipes]|nr:hypothetical protein TNCV_2709491 [Trichonephila clavipes]